MAWTFKAPMSTLSDAPTVDQAERLWERETLGGLTEDNNPIPRFVVFLVFLTVCTAFFVTFPLWGQRPTAALYAPYVNLMDNPAVLAAKDDVEAMQIIRSLYSQNLGGAKTALKETDARSTGAVADIDAKDTPLARHPVNMDQLRQIAPQIKALEARPGIDMRDYTVVGENVVLANFEGNYRPNGTQIRQQPWWDVGYTIDVFYLSAFFAGVFLVVKRLPPTRWQPRHGAGH
jgi:hypothetical protein